MSYFIITFYKSQLPQYAHNALPRTLHRSTSAILHHTIFSLMTWHVINPIYSFTISHFSLLLFHSIFYQVRRYIFQTTLFFIFSTVSRLALLQVILLLLSNHWKRRRSRLNSWLYSEESLNRILLNFFARLRTLDNSLCRVSSDTMRLNCSHYLNLSATKCLATLHVRHFIILKLTHRSGH